MRNEEHGCREAHHDGVPGHCRRPQPRTPEGQPDQGEDQQRRRQVHAEVECVVPGDVEPTEPMIDGQGHEPDESIGHRPVELHQIVPGADPLQCWTVHDPVPVIEDEGNPEAIGIGKERSASDSEDCKHGRNPLGAQRLTRTGAGDRRLGHTLTFLGTTRPRDSRRSAETAWRFLYLLWLAAPCSFRRDVSSSITWNSTMAKTMRPRSSPAAGRDRRAGCRRCAPGGPPRSGAPGRWPR